MTKKEFKELCSITKYGKRAEGTIAIFYGWKQNFDDGNNYRGFKYCIYARQANSTQSELLNQLYDYVHGVIIETDWWIQLVIAQTDEQRFKTPIVASGLTRLIKYK